MATRALAGTCVLALMLAACAGTGAGAAREGGDATITYQVGPCYGRCAAYSVTVSRSGEGLFTGEANTAVAGERRFTVTPAQFDAFAAALAPLRPAGERLMDGRPACRDMATDMSTVDVRWQGGGRPAHLRFNYGCEPGAHRATVAALQGAPHRLPIAAFIGARR